MNILYLGASNESSTSRHRANALTRLGHHVIIADPYLSFKKWLSHKLLNALHFRTGYCLLENTALAWITDQLENNENIDLVWVDSGELFGPRCIKKLRENNRKVILYNHDDPTGTRDGRRFHSLIKSLPYYSICAVVRNENNIEFYKAGAQQVIQVWRSHDEIAHAPYDNRNTIDKKYISDVVFIGTWMRHERRDEFLLQLINAGLNVKIWGQRWNKSPHWPKLKAHIGGAALSGREYVAAIQGSKVCLGFLSKTNRDLHTTRSMEIPYAGGVFCAQRTTEHQQLYTENVEAVFWEDIDECIRQCKNLVTDNLFRESIRTAGMQRVRRNKVGHENQCQIILDQVTKP